MSMVDDFVRESATNYLQSVVFVDDKIYESEGGKPLESIQLPPDLGSPLKPQFSKEKEGEGGEAALPGEAVHAVEAKGMEATRASPAVAAVAAADEQNAQLAQYHPRELMESFARRGIVCALYEPREAFKADPGSDLFRLCERADVVILDWDFYGDDGDAVSELLAELIKKGEAELPHHVRLCTLYTNRPSLHPVMDALFAKLKGRGCSVDVDQGKLRLIAGATRISIFGKPVTAGRPPDDKPYEVKEPDLADRVIAEFASLHRGVLPALALHGLAAIRRNTKRLLDKFRSDLDGPFLLHRALLLGDGDAFDELPALLSDEIRAVLEDAWEFDIPLVDISSSAIDELQLKEPNPAWKTKAGGQPYQAVPIFREVLKKGEPGLDAARLVCDEAGKFKRGFRRTEVARLKDLEEMLAVDGESWPDRLAALFCNRTQYDADERVLRFGAVVRHKRDESSQWEYSMCLMPICDSRRLPEKCAFPFWRLKENVKVGISGKRFGIVVIEPEGKARCMAAGGRIRDMLWIVDFVSVQGSVVAGKGSQGFRFDVPGMIVEWVAELKSLHAQRIAAYLGSEVSRVGLVESEWLRLFCDR